MHAPRFWNRPATAPGWQARLLSPLGMIYGRATARRVTRAPDYTAPIPVICIGNINAGGTGKTPTTIALAQRLTQWGLSVFIVTRGFGGSLQGPIEVDEYEHSSAQVGDEPLLLAAFARTFVAKDRALGVQQAVVAGADVVLMDDGFQNPGVAKALSLVVVDAHRGFGNGLCIPAGPLREPVREGLKRADLLISIGGPKAQDRFARQWGHIAPSNLRGAIKPLQTGMRWDQGRYFAFAGIGDPEKFFSTLRRLGADIVGTESLADHQPLSDGLVTRMLADATRLGAQLVTTEKDAARLPEGLRARILTLPVRLEIEDWAPLDDALGRINLRPKV